jgi:hypothetical protein
MKSFCSVLVAAVVVASFGCLDTGNAGSSSDCLEGSGVSKTVERTVDEFRAVVVDGVFDVTIRAHKKTPLSLTADDNLVSHIVTEVKDATLHIRPDRSICAKSAMRITVGTDALESLSAAGANDITLEKLAEDRLELRIDGSGSVSASGRSQALSAEIKGAAELLAGGLKAENVRITVSGAGDAEVYASKSLHVVISGAGDVVYDGNPADVQREISGWGEVSPK